MVKRKLTSLAGLLCAALALGLVFWLLPDGGMKGGNAAKGNGPQVTKPYPRERDARETRTKNPREEFEAARKRGLTEVEVRGIVEEFLVKGIATTDLNGTREKRIREAREKGHEWYLETLIDGIGLSGVQREEAESKLHQMLEGDLMRFQRAVQSKAINAMPRKGEGQKAGNDDSNLSAARLFEDMCGIRFWLRDGSLLPWNICKLENWQEEMIRTKEQDGQWTESQLGDVTLDYGTDKRYVGLCDPFVTGEPLNISEAGNFFPLSMEQVDRIRQTEFTRGTPVAEEEREPSLLIRVQFLAVPQLRTLLLYEPEMAVKLMEELGE